MASMYRVRTAVAGGAGGAQLSTFWFEKAGSLTAQDAADAVHTFWNTLKTVISSSYSFTVENFVTVITVETGEPSSVEGVTSSLVQGTAIDDALPWQTQGLIRMDTNAFHGGRQVIGHLYIPGPTEPVNTAGVPTAGYSTALQSTAATLNGSALVNWGVYSRKNRTFENITAVSSPSRWAVLRSRRD